MKAFARALVAVALFGIAPAALAGAPRRAVSVTEAYPEVVVLYSEVNYGGGSGPGAGRCTGTWIHPRLLLTAAHCVANFYRSKINGVVYPSTDMSGNVVPDRVARPSEVFVQGRMQAFGPEKIRPVRVHVSPDAIPVESGTLALRQVEQDIAILEFASDRATQTRRVTATPPQQGDSVVFVGFGRHGEGVHKHPGRNRLSMVDLDLLVSNGSAAVCRDPESHVRDWALCGGDSGGPLIDQDSGEVLGVASTSTELVNPTTGRPTGRKLSFHIDLTSPSAREFIRNVRAQVGLN
ncbi:MAG: trypsin-like serine protease [Bdellovibrionales bacterium]|nr:trypsin-like serine protease [Bdellovibrionales bacterium]